MVYEDYRLGLHELRILQKLKSMRYCTPVSQRIKHHPSFSKKVEHTTMDTTSYKKCLVEEVVTNADLRWRQLFDNVLAYGPSLRPFKGCVDGLSKAAAATAAATPTDGVVVALTKEDIINRCLANCDEELQNGQREHPQVVNDSNWTVVELFVRQYLNNMSDGFGMTNVQETYEWLVEIQPLLIKYNLLGETGRNNSGFPLWSNYDIHKR